MVERLPGIPERVTIYESRPPRGLHNEDAVIRVQVKAEFVRRLVAAVWTPSS